MFRRSTHVLSRGLLWAALLAAGGCQTLEPPKPLEPPRDPASVSAGQATRMYARCSLGYKRRLYYPIAQNSQLYSPAEIASLFDESQAKDTFDYARRRLVVGRRWYSLGVGSGVACLSYLGATLFVLSPDEHGGAITIACAATAVASFVLARAPLAQARTSFQRAVATYNEELRRHLRIQQ